MKKIAFILEKFAPASPAQQLLDRFSIGYPRDGEFRKFPDGTVTVAVADKAGESALAGRSRDFRPRLAPDSKTAVSEADAIAIIPADAGAKIDFTWTKTALENAAANARCFLHGVLGNNETEARQLADIAKQRGALLCGATSVATAFQLPEIPQPLPARIVEGVIVTHGAFPAAALDGLTALFSFLDAASAGKMDLVKTLRGPALWTAGQTGEWSRDLLGAAVSRSNTIQGDPEKDGRTQDIVGLGLAEKLAPDPRGWLLRNKDGARFAILALTGALKDINVAFKLANGRTISTQLYRPPPPNQEEFSRLAAGMEDFFRTGKMVLPLDHGIAIAGLMGRLQLAPD